MKKILITGATGTVGSEVVRQLTSKTENVRAAVRNPEKAREINLGNAKIVHWDYDKPASFENALENTERLMLIAPSGSPNSHQYLNPAVDAAKRAGVKHIVLLSAMGVDSNDEIPLRKVELHIQSSGIDYTFVRPNWFMQNFVTWMGQSIKEGGIYLPAGTGKTTFIDVKDVAGVIVEALTDNRHLNKEYNITGVDSLDHGEVAQKISGVIGKPVAYNDIPEADFKSALMGFGYPEDAADFMVMLYGPVKAGYTGVTTPDAESVLGRAPHSFDTFVDENKAAWE